MNTTFNYEMIKNIGESLGIKNVSLKISSYLTSYSEVLVREIIQDAIKFMRHEQKKCLNIEHVNFVLEERKFQSILDFRLNERIIIRDYLRLERLFLINNPIITMKSLIQIPIKKENKPSFYIHWLAIEGKQLYKKIKNKKLPNFKIGNIEIRKDIHNISKEDQQYLFIIIKAIEIGTHNILSKLYNNIRVNLALNNLLPYIIKYLSIISKRELKSKETNINRLFRILHISNCLISSSNLVIDLEYYLDQFLPIIVSLLICRKIYCKLDIQDQWELRNQAALVCARIIKIYENNYPSCRNRLTKILIERLSDRNECLETHYGCIVGLKALGLETVNSILIPIARNYICFLESIALKKFYDYCRVPVIMVLEAWLYVLGHYIRHILNTPQLNINKFFDDNKSLKMQKKNNIKNIEGYCFYSWISKFYGHKLIIHAPYLNDNYLVNSFI